MYVILGQKKIVCFRLGWYVCNVLNLYWNCIWDAINKHVVQVITYIYIDCWHYQYWDHYDSLILNQCLSPLKLCVGFPLMARCTLFIFIMFMLSSFRDLWRGSGFFNFPGSLTRNPPPPTPRENIKCWR
jgi:hypothetical protein